MSGGCRTTPGRRRFVLVGDPVGHSRSPAMHAEAFAALGLDAEYGVARLETDDEEDVATALRRLAESGGGNVTVPHKARAARVLDLPTRAVRETGACNCFWMSAAGALAGDNTDIAGIVRALDELLAGRRPGDVLILGAGGAAAAAGVAAGQLEARRIHVANRTPARATRLVARLRQLGLDAHAAAWPAAGTCDVVVNATSLGLRAGDPPPASYDRLTARVALDLVYPPAGADPGATTSWIRAARSRGIEGADGIEVLVHQAAACYPHWFGLEAPVDALRRGVRGVAAEG